MISNKKTIFISTGEVAGDLQGALLIEALHRQAEKLGWELDIVALGGKRMAEAGATLLGNTASIGSIGLLESLPFLLPTLKLQRLAKQYLRRSPPDLAVLIDYMGSNLSLGTHIKSNLPSVPTIYYITPQVWVWSPNPNVSNKIIGISDRLLAIFPEEYRFFQERNAPVSWVGHPLIDRIKTAPDREEARKKLGIESEQIAIALLPASRHQELKYLLPVMFQAAQTIQSQLPQVHFWIPLSLETYRSQIEQAIKEYGLRATLLPVRDGINLISTEVLAAVDLAITKSGTVNLELALLNIPQVVIYRVNSFTGWLARNLLKFSIPFMSPPNLVQMRSIVPELLQEQATPENIVKEALAILLNPEKREKMLTGYQEMRQALGEVGVCDRAASEILAMLSQKIAGQS